jgi:hypothetical protein
LKRRPSEEPFIRTKVACDLDGQLERIKVAGRRTTKV